RSSRGTSSWPRGNGASSPNSRRTCSESWRLQGGAVRSMIRGMGGAALRLLVFGLLAGCSSVRASAVRTGPLQLPPHVGPVAIYAAGEAVNGADLGVVEVHAAQSEATIDTLLPLFVQKAAQIGANAAVVESVRAAFEIVTHPQVETYSYACGYNATCV